MRLSLESPRNKSKTAFKMHSSSSDKSSLLIILATFKIIACIENKCITTISEFNGNLEDVVNKMIVVNSCHVLKMNRISTEVSVYQMVCIKSSVGGNEPSLEPGTWIFMDPISLIFL